MSRLVFDIGGTNMRMALAEEGQLHSLEKIPTPSSPEEAVATLGAFLTASHASPTDSVGGIAGIIKEGRIVDSPNLSVWNGFSFSDALSQRIGVPVVVYKRPANAARGPDGKGAGRETDQSGGV